MHIDLTPDQEFLVRQAVDAGRYRSREDVVRDVLARWEGQERQRMELVAALDEADASVTRDEEQAITPESMRALAEDVKRRAGARLAAGASGAP